MDGLEPIASQPLYDFERRRRLLGVAAAILPFRWFQWLAFFILQPPAGIRDALIQSHSARPRWANQRELTANVSAVILNG